MRTNRLLAAIIVLFATAVVVQIFVYMRGEIVVTGGSFRNIPLVIGEWQGEIREFSQEIYDELREDDNMYRIYRRPDGAELGLYIGYYGTKRGGHPEHIPQGCYTGAGWGVVEDVVRPVALADGRTAGVHDFYAQKGEQSEQVLYWVQNYRGVVIASGLTQNVEKMKNKLFNRRNDGAFIRINALVTNTREETRTYEEEFLKLLMPQLTAIWPKEELRRAQAAKGAQ